MNAVIPDNNEAPRAKAHGFSEQNTERSQLIRPADSGAVLWPRMYKLKDISRDRPNGIFITGTDTAVGKSMVCGCLAGYLLARGFNVITQKWIQTGATINFSQDIKFHLKVMGRGKKDISKYLGAVCPYIFRQSASPHLASVMENKKIYPHKIIKSFRLLSERFDFVIVEGIGGALVPFNKKQLVIDIVKELDLPVLIVAENKLGAINQVLLTIEALKIRKINILGLVFNNRKGEEKIILKDNLNIIKILTKEMIFGVLPWRASLDKLGQGFIPIGDRIFKYIKYG